MAEFVDLRDFSRYRTSAWALIAANLMPLLGVLFFGWDTFSIVALYWVENIIIGAVNVLKMIACDPDPRAIKLPKFAETDDLQEALSKLKQSEVFDKLRMANHGSKLFLIPFFIFHYGLFCFVHGVFVFAIFGRDEGGFGPYGGGWANVRDVFSREHLWLGVVALAASHLWSFFVNYLGRGEYRRTAVPILMAAPYARVFVLHVAILLGGIVAMFLGSNILVLMILIAGKTMLDLSLHLRERERNDSTVEEQAILPEVILKKDDNEEIRPSAKGKSLPVK